jgi:hypothetical protein
MRTGIPIHGDPTAGRAAGLEFYVSTIDGSRTALLLGPYDTHEQAKAQVARGRDMANEANWRAAFYAFGTCSAPKGTGLRTVFGT